MPPKRQAPTDDQSPPPAQRPAIPVEHHLSPKAGNQQEIPADAAVATSTPPRVSHNTTDMQPPNANPSANIDPNAAAQNTSAQQDASAIVPVQVAVTNGGARAAYIATQQLRIITCNLANIPISASHKKCHHKIAHLILSPGALQQKIRLTGIIIVMYSPQPGPPARMYMLVADKDGVAGVTVWGDTVQQLLTSPDVVGRAITIPGCTISSYQGRRSLNVPRNHVIQLPDVSPHKDWWEEKLQAESLTTKQMQALQDNAICNLFAVCQGMRRDERTQGKNRYQFYCIISILTLRTQPMEPRKQLQRGT